MSDDKPLGIGDPRSIVQIRDDAYKESNKFIHNCTMFRLWQDISHAADMINAIQVRDEMLVNRNRRAEYKVKPGRIMSEEESEANIAALKSLKVLTGVDATDGDDTRL